MSVKCLLFKIAVLYVFFMPSLSAQEKIRNFLVLGVETAEDILSSYTQPAEEGLMYGLTGGWYNSAVVRDKWKVEVSLVTNGSFVPSEKRSFFLDTERFENLSVKDGLSRVRIPTILGGSQAPVKFVATLQDETYEFESSNGFGLADLNLLPNAFLQAKVGLPEATELGVRIFPKIQIDALELGMFGLSAQHQFSRWIKPMESSRVALSALMAYTRLFGDYNFETGGDVTGEGQQINLRMNSLLFELIGSTRYDKFNIYGGVGYVTGDSETRLRGTYEFTKLRTSRTFQDPMAYQNKVSGLRVNLGMNLRLGRFGLNSSYTFQGYNNLSFAANYNF